MKLIAAVAGLLMATSAFAGEVDARASCEQSRINQGVRSGELTRREAGRLEGREVAIRREIHRDRAFNGGVLSPGEKARINRQENRLRQQRVPREARRPGSLRNPCQGVVGPPRRVSLGRVAAVFYLPLRII